MTNYEMVTLWAEIIRGIYEKRDWHKYRLAQEVFGEWLGMDSFTL